MDRCMGVWMACLTHIGWAIWLLFLMIPLTFMSIVTLASHTGGENEMHGAKDLTWIHRR